MKFRAICRLVCLALLATAATAFAEKPWTEVRSPHFRVLTNGSVADGRHVAREFEQLRYVFATEYPSFRLESGAPLTIFAAQDEYTAKSLEPFLWKAMKGGKPAGVFHHGWEKQYVMVRLDATGLSPQQEVFHEYAHSILHLNTHWLPTWLDEDMAEFYGYTLIQGDWIGGIGMGVILWLTTFYMLSRIPGLLRRMDSAALSGQPARMLDRRELLDFTRKWESGPKKNICNFCAIQMFAILRLSIHGKRRAGFAILRNIASPHQNVELKRPAITYSGSEI